MKINKTGFTLAEVLISMTVVGMILALSVGSIKIARASYTPMAHFVFENMKGLVGSIAAGNTSARNDFLDDENKRVTHVTIPCVDSTGKRTNIINPDVANLNFTGATGHLKQCSALKNNVGSKTFCRAFTSLANHTSSVDCENFQEIDTSSEPKFTDSFDVNAPNITTTNGQRYYFSPRAYSEIDEMGYRLVAVDINGKSKPNTMKVSVNKQPPDIITFMVMDNGDIYPLGVAADNISLSDGRIIQYLNTKLKGYYYDDTVTRTSGVPKDCFLGAKQVCNYSVVNIPMASDGTIASKPYFNYRDAFCASLGPNKTPSYSAYCTGKARQANCPPSSSSTRYDMCRAETIKPMFRYNL